MAPVTVLVVDDDHYLVNLMKENFELEGYQVITGFDGRMAVELAMTQRPDLIVLDINMPLTNGLDALTHIRKAPETRQIPVIFTTGIQSKTLYPVIDRHPRVSYVKKPVDLEQLNSMVRQFLAKYPVEREAPQKTPQQPPSDSVSTPPPTVPPFIQKLR
jgi:CheY-like chemotaxis protein